MTAPYRDELAALEARYAALEAEVADRARARDEAARMLEEARARARNEEMVADALSGGPERRRRRNLAIVAAVVGVVAMAFGGLYLRARRSAPARHEAEILAKFGAFTDQLCACATKACGDEVQDRMTKWAQDMARESEPESSRTSDAFADRITKMSQRYVDCYTKLVSPATAERVEP